MAIGTNNYQILSPEQANPLMTGLSAAIAARYNSAKAKEAEAQLPYAQKKALADLIQAQLMNQYREQVNKYYAPNIESEIRGRDATTGLTNKQVKWYDAKAQSDLDLNAANTANLGTQNQVNQFKLQHPGMLFGGTANDLEAARYLQEHPDAYKSLEQYLNTQNQAPAANAQTGQAAQNVPGYGGMSFVPGKNPAGLSQGLAAYMNQQQQAQQPQQPQNTAASILMRGINADIAEKEALANYRNSGGMRGGVGLQELNSLARQIQTDNPALSPDQINDATNAYLEGRRTLKDGTPLPEPKGKTLTLLNEIYKRQTDVGSRRQQTFAATLEETFKKGDQIAPGAFKFASAAGKVRGGIEALKAQRGDNDPDYLDYLNFTTELLPAMASEILRTGGANSTDSQKAMAIQQANPIQWYNNPALAMSQYEFLKSLYRKIGKTVAKGPYETAVGLQNSEESATKPTVTDLGTMINNSTIELDGKRYRREGSAWIPV